MSACQRPAGVRSPWAFASCPFRIAGRILGVVITAVFIGLAAVAGGRVRIERPAPDSSATDVVKQDRR